MTRKTRAASGCRAFRHRVFDCSPADGTFSFLKKEMGNLHGDLGQLDRLMGVKGSQPNEFPASTGAGGGCHRHRLGRLQQSLLASLVALLRPRLFLVLRFLSFDPLVRRVRRWRSVRVLGIPADPCFQFFDALEQILIALEKFFVLLEQLSDNFLLARYEGPDRSRGCLPVFARNTQAVACPGLGWCGRHVSATPRFADFHPPLAGSESFAQPNSHGEACHPAWMKE